MAVQFETRDAFAAHARPAHLSIAVLGWSIGLFLSIAFSLCVLFDLVVPSVAMNPVWLPLLPWVTWISWPGFFLGLVETFAYGWFVALIFVPLFNYFSQRLST